MQLLQAINIVKQFSHLSYGYFHRLQLSQLFGMFFLLSLKTFLWECCATFFGLLMVSFKSFFSYRTNFFLLKHEYLSSKIWVDFRTYIYYVCISQRKVYFSRSLFELVLFFLEISSLMCHAFATVSSLWKTVSIFPIPFVSQLCYTVLFSYCHQDRMKFMALLQFAMPCSFSIPKCVWWTTSLWTVVTCRRSQRVTPRLLRVNHFFRFNCLQMKRITAPGETLK